MRRGRRKERRAREGMGGGDKKARERREGNPSQ